MSGRPARKPWASADLRMLHERTWKTQADRATRRACESLASAIAGETQEEYTSRKRWEVFENSLDTKAALSLGDFTTVHMECRRGGVRWMSIDEMCKIYPPIK